MTKWILWLSLAACPVLADDAGLGEDAAPTAPAETAESTPSESNYRYVLEGFLGSAYSLPTRLTIYQTGQPRISHDATWSTPTFEQAPYYAFRFGWWRRGKTTGWEVEDLHHKVELSNRPPEIGTYKITFGYNIFSVNRAWEQWGFVFRAGLGLVIAHPINTVRGKTFNAAEGGILGTEYFLTGVGAIVGAQKRWTVWKSLFVTLEAKYSLAYANIPVAEGVSMFTNHALHGLFGVGWVFE